MGIALCNDNNNNDNDNNNVSSNLPFLVNYLWKVLLLSNIVEILHLFNQRLELFDSVPHRNERFIELLIYLNINI